MPDTEAPVMMIAPISLAINDLDLAQEGVIGQLVVVNAREFLKGG